MRMPSATLKRTQAEIQSLVWGCRGRRIDERIRGTAGRRKRASWCGKMLRTAMPDRAERRGRLRYGRLT
jgi:hypothetical protein